MTLGVFLGFRNNVGDFEYLTLGDSGGKSREGGEVKGDNEGENQ